MKGDSWYILTCSILGALAIIAGTALAAFDQYPAGAIVLLFGGVFWTTVGFFRKDYPLLITNLTAITFGVFGLLSNFL